MLPILTLNNFVEVIRTETRSCNKDRTDIGKQIHKAAKISHLDAVDFPDIHERLIGSHTTLTSALAPFIEASCDRLKAELKNVRMMVSPGDNVNVEIEAKTQEFVRCMDQMESVATDLITLRKGIILRMDMHLKAVSQSSK